MRHSRKCTTPYGKEEHTMVVLVRCSDETHTLALESRLDKLINDGLIVAYLKDGQWIPTIAPPPPTRSVDRSNKRIITAVVSGF